MIEALNQSSQVLDAVRLNVVREQITASLKPVRPLPSDSKMVLVALVLFVLFWLFATLPFGYEGFRSLNAIQKCLYCLIIASLATLFSVATVQEMVPGTRPRIHPVRFIPASLISLILLAFLLFRRFDFVNFVALGLPCLRLGVICAAFYGLISLIFVRKAFFVSPVKSNALLGCFAGLAAVAVLAFHCSIKDSAHVIVWHLGSMIIGTTVGAAIGRWNITSKRKLRLQSWPPSAS